MTSLWRFRHLSRATSPLLPIYSVNVSFQWRRGQSRLYAPPCARTITLNAFGAVVINQVVSFVAPPILTLSPTFLHLHHHGDGPVPPPIFKSSRASPTCLIMLTVLRLRHLPHATSPFHAYKNEVYILWRRRYSLDPESSHVQHVGDCPVDPSSLTDILRHIVLFSRLFIFAHVTHRMMRRSPAHGINFHSLPPQYIVTGSILHLTVS